MAYKSYNAAAVAHKVVSEVLKGNKVNLRKIITSQGYAPSVGTTAQKVTKQKSYTDIVNPAIRRMEKQRDDILTAMEGKDLTQEKYTALVSSLDILTKNMQLLGGKATDNVALNITISEIVASKNTTPDKDSQAKEA